MSGPYGPNDPDQGWAGPRDQSGNDSPGKPADDEATRVFNPPPAGQQAPGQQWGQQWPGQQPPQEPQWGQQPTQQAPNQQWGQQQPPPGQPWGQQPATPAPGQNWGQQQPPQTPGQSWGQPAGGQAPGQQWGQQQPPAGQQPYGAGQQQYPPQYGGSFPQSTAGSGNKSKLPLIIGAVVAVLVIAGIVVAALMLLGTDKLDQKAAQEGVQKILTESYGAQDVTDVSCPSGEEVKKDAQFTCKVKVDGEDKTVTVTFTDDEGTYEVGRPN